MLVAVAVGSGVGVLIGDWVGSGWEHATTKIAAVSATNSISA